MHGLIRKLIYALYIAAWIVFGRWLLFGVGLQFELRLALGATVLLLVFAKILLEALSGEKVFPSDSFAVKVLARDKLIYTVVYVLTMIAWVHAGVLVLVVGLGDHPPRRWQLLVVIGAMVLAASLVEFLFKLLLEVRLRKLPLPTKEATPEFLQAHQRLIDGQNSQQKRAALEEMLAALPKDSKAADIGKTYLERAIALTRFFEKASSWWPWSKRG